MISSSIRHYHLKSYTKKNFVLVSNHYMATMENINLLMINSLMINMFEHFHNGEDELRYLEEYWNNSKKME